MCENYWCNECGAVCNYCNIGYCDDCVDPCAHYCIDYYYYQMSDHDTDHSRANNYNDNSDHDCHSSKDEYEHEKRLVSPFWQQRLNFDYHYS